MGNHTSSRKSSPKEKCIEPLPLLNKCPFCNNKNSVESKMHNAQSSGMFSCCHCMKVFQRKVNYLHELQDHYNYYLLKYGTYY